MNNIFKIFNKYGYKVKLLMKGKGGCIYLSQNDMYSIIFMPVRNCFDAVVLYKKDNDIAIKKMEKRNKSTLLSPYNTLRHIDKLIIANHDFSLFEFVGILRKYSNIKNPGDFQKLVK